jgi:hypothetical protein
VPKPTSEQLAKINRFAHTPRTEEDTYVFQSMMIDNMPTSYSSKIHPNLLMKFSQDADRGVGLLMNHNHRSLPVGRSFSSSIRNDFTDSGETATSLYGEYYIDLGRKTEGGMTTDDLVKGIDAGTIFDTSIGFSADSWKCSLCNHDIRDYNNCSHWPGETYEIKGDDGVHRQETCYVIAGEDGKGELLENSLVYAGAAPRATITKTNFSADGDRENPKGSTLHLVENFKNIPLNATIYSFYSKAGSVIYTEASERTNGSELLRKRSENQVEFEKLMAVLGEFSIDAKDEDSLKTALAAMADKSEIETELSQAKADLEAAQSELATTATDLAAVEQKLSAKDEVIAELTVKNEELAEKAGIAETYQADLVTQTSEFAVRVFGNSFDAESFTAYLNTLSIDKVKAQLNAFKSQHEANYSQARTTETKQVDTELYQETQEDFESENEFRAHVAEEAKKYAAANPGMTIREATTYVYSKLSKKEDK